MKISDRITANDKQKLQQMTGQVKKRNGKRKHRAKKKPDIVDYIPKEKKEKPERMDWIDIMGMNRDAYKRVNGAIRKK
ncbi:hypothetical protein [Peribacillus kribbensis]|uniref:hypothetical protein n=1 Tax=Peribacillus kribbensis TaxID=356658 RepID=UPI00041F992F|nr:hypothetical protein [Peribacillus kribbensis]